MADTTNHVSVAGVLENTTLDPDTVNDTLTEWESKTARLESSNVRDEALDSFALGPMRSTYIAKKSAGVQTKTDADDTQVKYLGWLGNGYNRAPIQPASGSTSWNRVNFGRSGLLTTGEFSSAGGAEDFSGIAFPLYAMDGTLGDFLGNAFNEYNRWIIYCSCEVMVQRPRVNAPQIELALGYSFTNGIPIGDWTILPHTRRGLGIGKTGSDLSGGGDDSVPTSLSYTVVTKFAPELSDSDDGDTEGKATVYVSLFGRYQNGRDWNTWRSRFWWAAMNLNMFAVNYRR